MYFNQKLVSMDVLGHQVADNAVPKAILVSRHHPIAGGSANFGKMLVHQLMDTARIHQFILPCQETSPPAYVCRCNAGQTTSTVAVARKPVPVLLVYLLPTAQQALRGLNAAMDPAKL